MSTAKWQSSRVAKKSEAGHTDDNNNSNTAAHTGSRVKLEDAARIREQGRQATAEIGGTASKPFEIQETVDAMSNLAHMMASPTYELKGKPIVEPYQTREEFDKIFMEKISEV